MEARASFKVPGFPAAAMRCKRHGPRVPKRSGLYKRASGELFYNDISTRDMGYNRLRRQMGFVTRRRACHTSERGIGLPTPQPCA